MKSNIFEMSRSLHWQQQSHKKQNAVFDCVVDGKEESTILCRPSHLLSLPASYLAFITAISTATVISTGVVSVSSQLTIETTPKLGLLLSIEYARAISSTSWNGCTDR